MKSWVPPRERVKPLKQSCEALGSKLKAALLKAGSASWSSSVQKVLLSSLASSVEALVWKAPVSEAVVLKAVLLKAVCLKAPLLKAVAPEAAVSKAVVEAVRL